MRRKRTSSRRNRRRRVKYAPAPFKRIKSRGSAPKNKIRKRPRADRLQTALKSLRQGKSVAASARKAGMSRDRLRRVLVKNKLARKERGRRVRAKQGARRMLVYSTDGALSVAVSYRTSQRNGAHLAAVKAALDDQDFSRLNAYEGKYIIDLAGKRHYFETRPNVLYQLDQAGAEPYEQVYQYIV